MKLLTTLSILLFIGLGCIKDLDDESPVITLNTPTLGQFFNYGDPIRIKGTVTDNEVIREIFIFLTNSNTNAEIIKFELEPNTSSHTFDYSVAAVAGTPYRLQVVAKDKNRNDARRLIQFTCN